MPVCKVLIERDQGLIMQKIREYTIDLLIGGMPEQPMAKTISIDHVVIMHTSRQTTWFFGARTHATLLEQESMDVV
jgi:Na+-transporting NADH:ubiquinone oxidoreductase subunit NqrF